MYHFIRELEQKHGKASVTDIKHKRTGNACYTVIEKRFADGTEAIEIITEMSGGNVISTIIATDGSHYTACFNPETGDGF